MNKTQKYWLYFVVGYAVLHIIRDIFQDLGINTILSTTLVKATPVSATSSFIWHSANTYLIAVAELILALYCLKRKQFGKAGRATIYIALVTLIGWVVYWFFV